MASACHTVAQANLPVSDTKNMQSTATTLTSWAKTIKLAVEADGLDSTKLFQEAGLDMSELADANARYPLQGTTHLWQLARAATANECIGLVAARYTSSTTFHALGYSLLASATLVEAFERLIRYFRIVTNAGDLQFEAVGDDYRVKLLINPEGPQPAHEAVDAFITVIINMCRNLHGKGFTPLRVSLCRPRPENTAAFDFAMRSTVIFDAEVNEIIIAGSAARKPLDSANTELARHNEKVINRYLAQFEKEDLISRVQSVLIGMLPNGDQSQEAVAAALNMSSRNFQRKLELKGTSWKDLLNITRSELAKSYLKNSQYSISEIVFLLGFSDAGSFTRAFRRWEGQSPTAWRNNSEKQ